MNFDAARDVGRDPHGGVNDDSVIDFSANANPRIPGGVADVYSDALADARSYPTEPPVEFVEAAAAYVDCPVGRVIPTPGGLAAIRAATALAVDEGDTALVPAPSFAEYVREVRLQGGDPEHVPHDSVLDADPTEHALAVVCNPNNPTGNAYDHDALREFAARCREADTRLLVDEAFLGFTDRPSMAGVEGVVVARSLTKLFGLPGLRAGFAVATGDFRAAMANARRPWNVGVPALAAGAYCMRQSAFVEATRERVRKERERLRTELSTRFEVVSPSEAPFLLVDVGDRDVRSLREDARERGIELRDARTFRGLDSHVRVAVRTRGDNDELIEVLTDV